MYKFAPLLYSEFPCSARDNSYVAWRGLLYRVAQKERMVFNVFEMGSRKERMFLKWVEEKTACF
jgi:hypothetical protein